MYVLIGFKLNKYTHRIYTHTHIALRLIYVRQDIHLYPNNRCQQIYLYVFQARKKQTG